MKPARREFRDKDQLAVSGWWTALTPSTSQNAERVGAAADQVKEGDLFVIRGNLLGGDSSGRQIISFGTTNADVAAASAGATVPMRDGGEITVQANGGNAALCNMQAGALNNERLYIHGIFGYSNSGGAPSGTTFITVDTDWQQVFVGDINATEWAAEFSGPETTDGDFA